MKILKKLEGGTFSVSNGDMVVCTSSKSAKYYAEGEAFIVTGSSLYAATPRNFERDQVFDGSYGTWRPYQRQLIELEDML